MSPTRRRDLLIHAIGHRGHRGNAKMNESFATSYRAYLRLAVCGAGLALLGSEALAEETGLEEIVVTAQRRSENIQNVPIAVSAFTSEALQSKGITDVHALSNLTPGVNLDA